MTRRGANLGTHGHVPRVETCVGTLMAVRMPLIIRRPLRAPGLGASDAFDMLSAFLVSLVSVALSPASRVRVVEGIRAELNICLIELSEYISCRDPRLQTRMTCFNMRFETAAASHSAIPIVNTTHQPNKGCIVAPSVS